MNKRNLRAALIGLIVTAVLATAQAQTTQMSAPPAKHHHKVVGTFMVLGGVALVGLGVFALAQPCPKEARAAQISQEIGRTVTAGACGSSWLQKDKTAIGAGATGAGAALAIGGFFAMRSHERTAVLLSPAATAVK